MDNKLEKLRNIYVCGVFFVIIVGIFVAGIILPHKDISTAERRKLAKMPDFTTKALFDGQYMTGFEKYALDQFVLRDEFRNVKASFSFNILQKQDNNKVFVLEDEIYRIEYPLLEKDITNAAIKLNKVYDMYLKDMACYYSIVPDKSYYVAEENGYLALDYKKLEQMFINGMGNMEYINLFEMLDRQDYYKTDTHWRQENLQDVLNTLATAMSFTPADISSYKVNSLENFKGVYYGQSALKLPSESLNYLTNEITDNARVFNYETQKEMPMYDTEKFNSTDPYNLFLAGPVTIVEITNDMAKTDKELIIFRDSFGSSIAPMLVESYKKVTLIDLRYIPASKLAELIDFKDQDVLFLYSTLILNNSTSLRL